MFVLAIQGKEYEGAYAVTDPQGEKALYLFEEVSWKFLTSLQ